MMSFKRPRSCRPRCCGCWPAPCGRRPGRSRRPAGRGRGRAHERAELCELVVPRAENVVRVGIRRVELQRDFVRDALEGPRALGGVVARHVGERDRVPLAAQVGVRAEALDGLAPVVRRRIDGPIEVADPVPFKLDLRLMRR